MNSWLDSLKSVKITSSFFGKNNEFPLFVKKDKDKTKLCRVSFVFGENGTGKSTLAKALKNINKKEEPIYAMVRDDVNVSTAQDCSTNVFIYNQEFIDNNVRYLPHNKNGLQTIVLLGGQVGLQNEIDDLESSIKCENTALQDINIRLNDCCNPKNINSYLYWKKSIIEGEIGNEWRRREADIKGKNASISASIFEQIISYRDGDEDNDQVLDKYTYFINRYNKLIDVLKKTKNTDRFRKLKKLPTIDVDVNRLMSCLNYKVDKKILTEVAQKIRSELSVSELETSRSMLMSRRYDFCPLCLRTLNADDRENSLSIINSIVDREERKLGDSLRAFKMKFLDMKEYEEWRFVDENKYNEIIEVTDEINKFIENVHNKIIDKKIECPSAIFEYPTAEIFSIVDRFNVLKNELQNKLNLIIDSANGQTKIIEELHVTNVDIAHCRAVSAAREYRKTLEVNNELMKDKEDKIKLINDLSTILNDKKANQRDEKIAIEIINYWLTLIYGTNQRLQLQMESSGLYQLLVRNKQVSPDRLSQGEQNALALVYFFAKITEGSNLNKLFDSAMLVVVDDPVSSFDDEVKIGIFSLLNHIILSIVESNDSSKILITTHDASVFNKLLKIGASLKKKTGVVSYILNNKALAITDDKQFSEYEMLMREAFAYACADPVIDNPAIGNILRRIMEAASTYHFRKNVNDINFDISPFDKLEGNVALHFKNVCLRMFLNDKSHQQEVIGIPDWTLISGSGEESRRVARVVFCILYILSASHVKSFLPGYESEYVDNNIKLWIDQLK